MDAFIVGAVRTPLAKGKKSGDLHSVHPVHLLGHALKGLMQKTGVDPVHVEDVLAGCVLPVLDQGGNVGRLAALWAGFPQTVPGLQLNRACGSSQQAVHLAAACVASGQMELAVACGVEMMSRVPMGLDSSISPRGTPVKRFYYEDAFLKDFPYPLQSQGLGAEDMAVKWRISRREADELASDSHSRCAHAIQSGFFDEQIVPVPVVDADNKVVQITKDSCVRYPSPVSKLSTLKTVFKKGPHATVTAGNASQITDGAAALLISSRKKALELGLRPMARVVACCTAGDDPVMMLAGVIPATRNVLRKANLEFSDMDVIEINEAFANVVLAWKREFQPDMAKVNPNGGAMAHGHPLGATGAVLMTKLVHEMTRSGKRYGMQVMCTAHGMATATILERVTEWPTASARSRL